ncbi:MAG TPA: hypothetical protein VNF47_00360 [Streptosporangiaceae bacterium]|nr:hypothetical protein [Streptosporangiaceae bacterium]
MSEQACEGSGNGADVAGAHQANYVAGILVGFPARARVSRTIPDLVSLRYKQRRRTSNLHANGAAVGRVKAIDQHDAVIRFGQFDALNLPGCHLVVRRDRRSTP